MPPLSRYIKSTSWHILYFTIMPAHATGLLRSVACPICFKMLKDPTILDCGHTFCCSCLKHLQESSCTVFIFCPVCRKINYDSLFKRKNYCAAQVVEVIKSSQAKSVSPPLILKPVTSATSRLNHRYTNKDGGDQEMRSPPPQSYSNIEDDNKENTTTCDYIPNNIRQEKPEPSNDEQTPKHESQGFEETHDIASDESSLTGSIPWWLYPAMTILRDSLLDEWLKLGTLQN